MLPNVTWQANIEARLAVQALLNLFDALHGNLYVSRLKEIGIWLFHSIQLCLLFPAITRADFFANLL